MVEDFEDPELEALVEEGLAEIAAYADIRANGLRSHRTSHRG